MTGPRYVCIFCRMAAVSNPHLTCQDCFDAAATNQQPNKSWYQLQIGKFWIGGDDYGTMVLIDFDQRDTNVPINLFIGASEQVIQELWRSNDWEKLVRMSALK